MDSDLVFYGTPIEEEDDVTISRKKKSVAEASGQLRTLPSWKQEVRDEEGRRRFHGAFTGGYSAGYFNTVGSKEGWTPSTFTSSRNNRAQLQDQTILNFLDQDEKTDLEDRSLSTSMQFDTFGFTALELAKKQAQKDQQQRPSVIPGPVPHEMLAPLTESIGVKLLLKMGWRRGRSIKDSQAPSLYDTRREARKAFLALAPDDAKEQIGGPEPENVINVADGHSINDDHSTKRTPLHELKPKQDLHGLGYDPYKHAPEFRENKRLRLSGNDEKGRRKPLSFQDSLFGFKSGRVAPGFGIGALEDLDVEDEDVYAAGYDFEETDQVEDIEEPSRPRPSVKMIDNKQHGILPGFKAASAVDYQLERFNPPLIPKDFTPHHKFSAPLEMGYKVCEVPPPEVPPPEDNNLKVLIEGVATLVARCGSLFEDLSREKNRTNHLFAFLSGGNGHEFYKRKLWEERQKCNDKTKQQSDSKMSQKAQKMTAESRGRILGEKPLERSLKDSIALIPAADTQNLQLNLSDTFTQPASLSQLPEAAKPFLHDPAKQERFEQFLKEKYQGGLRVIDAGEASKMSEASRARERLEFEAAAEVIAKGNSGKESKPPSQLLADVLANSGLQFTASTIEKSKDTQDGELPESKMYPRREEYQWRPSPLLCKRFDLIDPFMGKPPPPPRPRSKMESFVFMSDSSKPATVGESLSMDKDLLFTNRLSDERTKVPTEDGIEGDAEVENVERPVDLYKAIFSDDSDEEVDSTNPNLVGGSEKKIEAANTTLSRLIAGDFLESLGKELGLEVPPDLPYSENKASAVAQKQSSDAKMGEKDGLQLGKSSISIAVSGTSSNHESSHNVVEGDRQRNSKLYPSDINIKKDDGESENAKKVGTSKRVNQHGTNSSSEDDSSKKVRRHRKRGRGSGNDSSSLSDYDEDGYRSRSNKKDKGSSRDGGSQSRAKHHSRHKHKHKHKRKDSPGGSRHGSGKERKERREARK